MHHACAALVLAIAGLTAAAAEPDQTGGAVEVLRYSFETDQDRDFDLQPDNWSRRRGAAFPRYVEAAIDATRGADGTQSLHVRANGGNAILYSPPEPVDPQYAYVFRGRIQTQSLDGDTALVSVSFLNHKRQRIQRFLTAAVGGTHAKWVEVQLGPLRPDPEVRFVVIGCHLVRGSAVNIHGRVWFDELWLGRLPQLTLESNLLTHFKQHEAPTEITSHVSGLDQGHEYQLRMQLLDGNEALVDSRLFPVTPQPEESAAARGETFVWTLPQSDYGYYRVSAALERDGQEIIRRQTTFAVMDIVGADEEGEFGWTIETPNHGVPLESLPAIARQAGINWVKYPLWQSASADQQKLSDLASAFETLRDRHISVVGLLNDPPPDIRSQFAEKWSGVSEVFSMPTAFWSPSLDPVIARFSSIVRYWQLGGDSDTSFSELDALAPAMAKIIREFNRIGRDTRLGLPWPADAPLPRESELRRLFVSLHDAGLNRLATDKPVAAGTPERRWTVIKPLAQSEASREVRGADLVKRMVLAKAGGAEAVFAYSVFDPEYGLLNPGGSPTNLFLPWRTTALALRGTELLGSFIMPGGSTNYVFARPDEVVIVLWNNEPTLESLYLGDNVAVADIWGKRTPARIDPGSGEQIIEVGPMPVILRGGSAPVARWCLAAAFEKGRLQSAYGDQSDALVGKNPFPINASGKVALNVPEDWTLVPRNWELQLGPGEEYRLPMLVRLPPNASIGRERTTIDFDIVADRRYQFRVYRPYDVGLGDVGIHVTDRKLPDGRLEVTQVIVNQSSPPEVLNLRCTLSIPGRQRKRLLVNKLGPGEDRKIYYLPNADSLRGQELWVRAEQVDGRRVLNYRWKVGENWDAGRSAARLRWPTSTAERTSDDVDRR